MSTYNGQKYLREQLDSLFSQEDVNLRIVIRDDGSKDETHMILSEYAKSHPNVITLLFENNCGAEESFNRLCKYALEFETADFYAFCDQDDVWDKDKLKVAVAKLNEFDDKKPNLYFSNLKKVDENLRHLGNLYSERDVFTDKSKTLVQIFTYGCTCVFNRKALIYYCLPDQQNTFHDNWIYCICSYLGNVFYDPMGHINYRQHGNNLSGQHTSGLRLLVSRIARPFNGNLGHYFEIMASQLLLFEKYLASTDLKLIKIVSTYRKSFKSRFYLLFSKSYSTGHLVKDLCIRFRILTNSL